ncbi:esterase family protein [Truepera radiovictrix]|uniref:Esterase n=1 Tax=Truepera radiovictrix (strain DSM 17093 / CIP 108686 / LMG 22925 / RQ-24) TaxID=649638 RepID=D7CUK8_TRURR|nr:alpha/beta hydrolase-fold protein [Truepera radiovictrix]ADI15793.1 putative esterase [Truepera radiovictrix DSM 17093]WMT58579.1 alpha/beta hydrolase-fold protein [Truepera radiovictrix]
MRRRYEKLYNPAIGRDVQVLAFGHYGAPLIAFPSGGGQFYDFEDNGMIGAVAHLIEAGKLKVYCPESLDHETWLAHKDPHERALRHRAYEDFILHTLVPAIRYDCEDATLSVALTGCSLGAFHAANFALKHPHVFPYALCLSGRYNAESFTGPTASQEVYFNNPVAYVRNFGGAHLEFVRRHAHLVLVCGQGAWEDKCLADTHLLADLLREKGVSHERDIWGHDVDHHWYWWRQQLAHHLGRALG